MAFIRHRGKTYSVVYKILDENGEEHTTSETFATQKEADKQKKEIEYKQSIGKFEVQKCATLKELIEEYALNFRRGSRCPKIAFLQSKFPKNGSLFINYCDIFEKIV